MFPLSGIYCKAPSVVASPLPPQSSPSGLSSQKTHRIKHNSQLLSCERFSVDTTKLFSLKVLNKKPLLNINSLTLINGFRAKLIETLKNLNVVLLRVWGHHFSKI